MSIHIRLYPSVCLYVSVHLSVYIDVLFVFLDCLHYFFFHLKLPNLLLFALGPSSV